MFFVDIKRVNKYYQKHKEKLRKQVRERYQNLSEKEKEKRQRKARDRYQNLSEEEKEKKVEYTRNYYLTNYYFAFLGFYKVVGNRGYLGTKHILVYKK